MKRIFILSLFALLGVCANSLLAQSCLYQFQLYDTFGDGWNGAEIVIHVNGVEEAYTFTALDNNGDSLLVFIPVENGDSISIDFSSGGFPNEESFLILDNDDQLIYESSMPPENGIDIFNFIVECVSCVAPPASTVEFFRLRSTSVDVIWGSATTLDNPTYYLEYGLTGFTPGVDPINGIETMDTSLRIQPLTDTTSYDFYLSVLCPTDTIPDTSNVRGPFTIFTPLSTDVGITAISSPISGCDLGSEAIRVGIANFGGAPQTFIPFDYSINGEPSGVGMPEDGFFVGIVGVGDVEFTEFDLEGDFTEPGIYEIKVWTALEDDMDMSNDTFSINIVSTTFVNDLPYAENFEDNDGFYTPVQAGAGPISWEYGTPAGNAISSAVSGSNAWVTNLTGDHNPNELSYLVSPCFDFTNADEDFVLSFFLNSALSFFGDGVFIETTTDGETWTKLGESGTGINWYNDTFEQWWDGDAGSPGWSPALQNIGSLAGEELVRFRFVLETSGFTETEGFGVDNIYIGPQAAQDLAAGQLVSFSESPCGSPEDQVTLSFFNIGTDEATAISLSYEVNGGPIVTEPIPDTVASGGSLTYTFVATYDGTQAATNVITAWVTVDNDGVLSNDTTSITVNTVSEFPLFEDFENGEPSGWQLDADLVVAQAHNSPSSVLYDNIWSFDPTMRAVTPNYGPVSEGDSLTFDYRYVDFSGGGSNPTTLGLSDNLQIRVIENCDTVETQIGVVNAFNHQISTEMRRLSFPLEEFAGSDIQVVFEATWGQGDYYLDLDNINLQRCPASFGLEAEVVDAASNTSSDGSINIFFGGGVAPYTFSWSDGSTSRNLTDVPAGDYVVTVTDAQGCSDQLEVRINFLVSTEEVIPAFGTVTAAPNPTTGELRLNIELLQQEDLEISLINQFGQELERRAYGRQDLVRDQLDLSRQPAGVYFVRMRAGNQLKTIRVLKVQ